MSGTESASATLNWSLTGTPGVFQYTVSLTNTGSAPVGIFWFAWDDVPDQDFMTQLPSSINAPPGWVALTTSHLYPGGTGYGIQWYTFSTSSRLAPGSTTTSFSFNSTETPTQMAAVSPFDPSFQTTSSFVYQTAGFGPAPGDPGGILVASVACFRAGTLIRTPSGDRVVESLCPGDPVLTAAGEIRPVIWTGLRDIVCGELEHPEDVWPVRVARDAIADGVPCSDLYLSPDHGLFLEGVLIPVKYLINGDTIARVPVTAVTYHHLELDDHEIILANAAPAETWLDLGGRARFDPPRQEEGLFLAASDSRHRHPLSREACSDLALVVTGPILDRIRGRLTARSRLPA